MAKECTKCSGEFTWKQPYDGTKLPSGDKPCTCSPKAGKAVSKYASQEPANTINSATYDPNPISGFTTIARAAYNQISVLAAELCEEGATARDKHICTCGLLHDYFSYRQTLK